MSADVADQGGPPSSKSEYVLRRLRAEIADGTLHPGAPLRQGDIAERYGVSATPVREALRLLEAEGLIIYASHRGATVADFDPNRIDDLNLMRVELEGLGAALAAERGTDEALERIEAVQKALKDGHLRDEVRELPRLNREFHFAIYEAASPVLPNFVGSLWGALPPSVTLWSKDRAFRQTLVDEHDAIISALRTGDAALARQAMSEHMQNAFKNRHRPENTG